MRSQPSQRRFRCLSGVLLALVAVCAVPSRVEAGCSHYVIAGKSPEKALAQLDILGRNAVPTSTSAAVPADTSVPSKPCSGALCSGKPAAPIPVPVAPGTNQVEQWGEMLPPPALLTVSDQLLAHSERPVRPVLEGPSIDRPPRSSHISFC